MRRRLAIAAGPAALAGIALVAAGCGGGGSGTGTAGTAYAPAANATARSAAAPALRTAHTTLGTVLVDGHGRTVYLFEKDKGMSSSCTGACASIWPPVTAAGTKAPGGGLTAAKLGAIKRADGKTEVTYAGHPLYTYAGDTKPGDVNGQGLDQFGAEWYVLAPDGHKVDNG
jgi:predicted lipoprotein with Yx(FWY)xxD motif